MKLSRRSFLQTATTLAGTTAFPWSVFAAQAKIQGVGSCLLGLRDAKQAGLDGVEVGAGGPADQLDIARPERIAQLKAEMQETGLPVCSIMMGLLNSNPLATDPRASSWLEQTIEAARQLGARNILVAFFGKGALQEGGKIKEAEFKVVVERLRTVAPRAADAGVILAVENTLTAEQNEQLLDAVGHPSVRIYYDVYNTRAYGVPQEIRRLGRRISQFHFKNGPKYLDDDPQYFQEVAAAVREIGYEGWIVLETSSPSKDHIADARRNGEYVRKLFA